MRMTIITVSSAWYFRGVSDNDQDQDINIRNRAHDCGLQRRLRDDRQHGPGWRGRLDRAALQYRGVFLSRAGLGAGAPQAVSATPADDDCTYGQCLTTIDVGSGHLSMDGARPRTPFRLTASE